MPFAYTQSATENMLRWRVAKETVEQIVKTGKIVERTSSETRSCGVHAGRLVTVRHTLTSEDEVLVINIMVTSSRRALREYRASRR